MVVFHIFCEGCEDIKEIRVFSPCINYKVGSYTKVLLLVQFSDKERKKRKGVRMG